MLEVVLLCVLGVVAANLPFLSDRVFLVVPNTRLRKHFGWELLEVLVLYAVVLGIARVLEARVSTVQPQHWWFYVATLALFVVVAWPGFVWRHFWRKPGM
ncbi:DUF2818 family protein [Amantichitinum ursilacus]|uniref:DUF2818 domain-containing protein n=1 Tax=Amantichitinum ursilacus TaxID=857265 RepID=A0A0N0XKB6_9NEIS|nr:DUF2818 family protein [Amantichitinum ursilacus]KPC54559.1 hypothetical protein WG78_03260 [Amantichitinum ursilacus]